MGKRLSRVLTEPFNLKSAASYAAINVPTAEELAKMTKHANANKFDGDGLRISAANINAGDILTADLRTHAGQLLLTKGTAVSDSMLKRICDIGETFGLRLNF